MARKRRVNMGRKIASRFVRSAGCALFVVDADCVQPLQCGIGAAARMGTVMCCAVEQK